VETRASTTSPDANAGLLCAYRALQMTLFPVAVVTLFWKDRIGLDMAEILTLQGLFGLSMAVFEFPSGYLADRLGYRRTLFAAALVHAAGWSLYLVADDFASVLAAEVVLGLGQSLVSGADHALLFESLAASEREGEFARWDGRVRFFGQTAEGTAALVAGLLYAWAPRLPFVLQLVVWLANAVVAWRLVDVPREPVERRGHLREIASMVAEVFVRNRRLRAVVLLTIVLGLASFVPVWLVPLYAREAGVATAWLGPIWAVANYTVALGSLWSHRVRRALGLSATLLLCSALIAVGYAGLGLTHAAYGFAFYFALTTMRGLFGPVLLHEEQRLIPSSDRAGYLSLRSLAFRLAFLALAPAIGAAIDARGQHAVLLVVGAGLVAASLLGWKRVRRVLDDYLPSVRST